jgi:hypothetical protein
MNIKYIGMDVHKEATAVAVINGEGKLVMESVMETKATTGCRFSVIRFFLNFGART